MVGAEERPTGEPTPTCRAVLFDAGNTLIYMPQTAEDILMALCHQLGAPIDLEAARGAYHRSESYYARNYLGYSGEQGAFWHAYHGEALRYLGIDDPDGRKAAFLSHSFGRAGVWQAYPEAERVCSTLRAMGVRLGVVSNGPVTVSDLLTQAGLIPFFETVIASQAMGIQKPDPRIFREALGRMGLRPNDALFGGDLYDVDVVGARSAGLRAVLIDRDGHEGESDCPTIRTLDELIPLVTMFGARHV
ncbi:MAG TPA: HAD family hydrolase [Chloroflexota bacterium]|nr:HAD family hydrolase [Chloroflexota bacterium]